MTLFSQCTINFHLVLKCFMDSTNPIQFHIFTTLYDNPYSAVPATIKLCCHCATYQFKSRINNPRMISRKGCDTRCEHPASHNTQACPAFCGMPIKAFQTHVKISCLLLQCKTKTSLETI